MSEHDDFEADFWNGALNTFNEEGKQLVYLREMGFARTPTWRTPYSFDGGGKSYIDIGGGPVSVLLKFENRGPSMVVDPMILPQWVKERYWAAGIVYVEKPGETFTRLAAVRDGEGALKQYDVALIYNCLQHTQDPEQVITNARAVASEVRLFEWIDIPAHQGHPHMLTESDLNKWTNRAGRVIELHGENECYGRAWILGGQ